MLMKTNILKILLITGVMVVLSGCVNMHLRQPLAKGSRISVVSQYGNVAHFKHIGTTIFQDSLYTHSLPDFPIDEMLVNSVSKNLQKYGYEIVPLDLSKAEISDIDYKSNDLGFGDIPSKKTKQILQKIANKYHINYLLVIFPSATSFDPEDDSGLLALQRYGLYYRSFFRIKALFVAFAVGAYLIDMNNFKLIAMHFNSFRTQTSSNTWKDKFSEFTKDNLRDIKLILAKNIPVTTNKAVDRMLLLGKGNRYAYLDNL